MAFEGFQFPSSRVKSFGFPMRRAYPSPMDASHKPPCCSRCPRTRRDIGQAVPSSSCAARLAPPWCVCGLPLAARPPPSLLRPRWPLCVEDRRGERRATGFEMAFSLLLSRLHRTRLVRFADQSLQADLFRPKKIATGRSRECGAELKIDVGSCRRCRSERFGLQNPY